MGGRTKNSGCVEGAYVLGEANKTYVIEMYHYVNNSGHPHTIDSAIKYGLADTEASGTYIRPDNTHKNAHKLGHTIFFSSSCGIKIPSNTLCTLALPQLAVKGREAQLLPVLSHRSLISIGKLCDAGFKETFDKQTVNITRKGRIILNVWRDHQPVSWCFPIHNQQTVKQNLHVETTKQANYVGQTKNLQDLINYLHTAPFIPVQ